MTRNAWVLILVLALFGALTGYALHQHGYFGILAYQLPSSAGWQVLGDVLIAGSLCVIWMVTDARRSGRNVWPYLVLTLFAGSFGPLLYLLIGELRSRQPRAAWA